jgi:putative ABC transport system permease protein
MFRNYIKIALRNLKKDKGYTLINLIGLSMGIGVCLIIFIFLQFHLSFDSFNKKAANIYRVTTSEQGPDGDFRSTGSMEGALAQTLLDEIPEVRASVRASRYGKTLITIGNENFYEENILRTDPSLFDIFTFPFSQGDPKTALSDKSNIVLTKSVAQKYFREQNPIGQEIVFNERNRYIVTGIVEDPPAQSHINFSMVINIPDSLSGRSIMDWNWLRSFHTYVLLDEQASPNDVEAKIPSILEGKMALGNAEFHLQSLTDIHLKSDLGWELFPERIFSINYIYLFSIVGIFILLIACINYVNLATARATTRLKEVGVRKAAGAQQGNLFWQFTGEILLLTFTSAVFSLGLVELLLPYVNKLMDLQLSSIVIWSPLFITGFISFIFLIGIISGTYPAFILSSFKPAEIFKGNGKLLTSEGLRKGLVVFQFSVSMILIISTIIIDQQLTYFQDKNLGLNTEQVLNISLESTKTRELGNVFLEKLANHSNIESVSASGDLPGNSGTTLYLYPFEDQELPMPARYMSIDPQFIKTMEMELIAGTNLTIPNTKSEQISVIVNETVVKEMGWKPDEAINQRLDRFVIIGVVKDFHFESLEQEIRPAVMAPLGDANPDYISARLSPSNISETMDWIRKEWDTVADSYPLQFTFMDDTFESLYRSEERLGILFTVFCIITIIIACLGLFGLMAFMATKRTKEIGIRKVLGASIVDIVTLLSKDFIKLVVLGFVIAIPIAWYATNQWLADFAYRIEVSVDIFAFTGISAILISFFTISWQAIKSALSNPVESLKSE